VWSTSRVGLVPRVAHFKQGIYCEVLISPARIQDGQQQLWRIRTTAISLYTKGSRTCWSKSGNIATRVAIRASSTTGSCAGAGAVAAGVAMADIAAGVGEPAAGGVVGFGAAAASAGGVVGNGTSVGDAALSIAMVEGIATQDWAAARNHPIRLTDLKQ
jgi:hypothetical protein